MLTKEIFYGIVSISGLATAIFMYWNVIREYMKNRLKPLSSRAVIFFFLLGIGLGVFNHFLALALKEISGTLNWSIRLGLVFLLGFLAWYIYRQAKEKMATHP